MVISVPSPGVLSTLIRATVLPDDVVRDCEAEARALPRRLRGEERVEDLLHHVLRHAVGVVPNGDGECSRHP